MKHQDVINAVYESLRELGYSTDEVVPATKLGDELGIDSIEAMELAAAVCKHLGVPWHTLDFRNVETVADLAARLEPLLGRLDSSTAH